MAVWTWGYNPHGELGNGTTTDSRVPVQVLGPGGTGTLSGITAIAVGGYHTLALKNDSSVWAWGYDGYGQLGNGTTGTSQSTPVQVLGPGGTGTLGSVTALTAGFYHSAALKSDGTVWSWGYGGLGALGQGSGSNSSSPVQVLGLGGSGTLSGITAIAAGGYHTLALTSSGGVLAWGYNSDGELGSGNTTSVSYPVAVVGVGGSGTLSGISALAGGGFHSLARTSSGTTYSWGRNDYGQLGTGDRTSTTSPVAVSGLTTASGLSGGLGFSLAVKSDGSAWAWGDDGWSQLGDNASSNRAVPTVLWNRGEYVQVSAGIAHSVGLKSDGTVWTWGANDRGQLGNGTTTNSDVPVQVLGVGGSGTLNSIQRVQAGGFHSLALKSDGSVLAWGSNVTGQLGDGTATNRTSPVAVSSLSGITSLGAGYLHSLAVKSDGSVWAWGYNSNGQLGDGTGTNRTSPVQVVGAGGTGTLSGISAVAGGGYNSLALASDGSVWAWGSDAYGQLGDNGQSSNDSVPYQALNLSGMTQVAAGLQHGLALAVPQAGRTAVTTQYGYDGLYRLTSVTAPTSNITYGYDPLGNRTSLVLNGSSTTYSYDRADRILSAGSTSYTVDANGNTTARGSDGFGYDALNRLISATVGGSSSTDVYSGDGLRYSQTSGGVTTRYVYGADGLLLDDGTSKYVYGPNGLVFTLSETGTTLTGVYHTDGLGSVRAITDSTGSVIQTYGTDAFGNPDASQTQGSVGQPAQYTGEPRDASGLIYLRARMYDPTVGRFLQADPLRQSAPGIVGWNRYTYVDDNPINAADPSGRCSSAVCSTAPRTGSRHAQPPATFHEQEIDGSSGGVGDIGPMGGFSGEGGGSGSLDAPLSEELSSQPYGPEPFRSVSGGWDRGESTPGFRYVYYDPQSASPWPTDFEPYTRPQRGVEASWSDPIKDEPYEATLQETIPGEWRKVYVNGEDAEGEPMSVHYAQNVDTGYVVDIEPYWGYTTRR